MTTRDHTDFTALPDLPGVTLIRRTGRIPTRARHMHQSLCVGGILDGERIISIGTQSATIRAGEAIVLTPGSVHACKDAGESEYIMVAFSPDALAHWDFDTKSCAPPSPQVKDPSLFKSIVQLAELNNGSASALEREAALLDILRCLNPMRQKMEKPAPPSACIETVRAYISSHFSENIRLETLARMAKLSPCRLNRTFAAQIGMPPHEYQNQQRVDEIKRLTAASVPLADAAAEAGFADQSHMTRCFKKIMGMTPGTYVKGLNKKHSH